MVENNNDLMRASSQMILTPSFSASHPCILLGHLVLNAMVNCFF